MRRLAALYFAAVLCAPALAQQVPNPIAGKAPAVSGGIAFWEGNDANQLKDMGWTDNGTRLTAPPGRNLTLRPTGGGGGAFQVGGIGGPMAFAQQGYEDTYIIQAQPGAAPSTDTTNLQLFAPVAGGKAFINFSDTSITPPDESRLVIGYVGPDFWIANVLAGAGTARNICVLDGKGPEFTACFVPRPGGGTFFPSLDLGPQVALRMANSTLSEQEILKIDTNSNLLVGGGSGGTTLNAIVLQKPIATVQPHPATASACGGTPTISGDATAGFVTVGTGTVTACSVGFGITYSTVPRVVLLTGQGTGSTVLSVSAKSTTNFTIAASVNMAGQSFSYFVVQ